MEFLDICTPDGNPTGIIVERSEAHQKGICHRTAHVWIAYYNGRSYQILLQKRSLCKDSDPGKYDTSSAGHIPAGVEPLDSALRELQEELGIATEKEELVYIGKIENRAERKFYSQNGIDWEVTFVYVYQKKVNIPKLALQKEEVESVRYFDLEEILDYAINGNQKFCIPINSLLLLKEYLYSLLHNE